MAVVDIPHAPGDFFRTGDFEPLPLLQHRHEMGRIDERLVRAGVEPGGAAAQRLDVQRPLFEVQPVHIGDLQFPARGRFDLVGKIDHLLVVEVQPGDSQVRLGHFGLLFNADRPAAGIHFDHTVPLGIADVVGIDGCPVRAGADLLQALRQLVPVEDVVAQDQ